MAITWVANSAEAYSVGGVDISVTVPGSVQDDDLIVLFHVHDDASDHTDPHFPTGFTEFTGSPHTTCGDCGLSTAYKVASSEGATWDFVDSPATEEQTCFAIVLRGVDTADPVDDYASACVAIVDTAPTTLHPSVTISSSGSFVVCGGGNGRNTYSAEFQNHTNFPDNVESPLTNAAYSSTSNGRISLVVASGPFGSGATGTLGFDLDADANEQVPVVSIAFNPSGGAPPSRRVMVIS